METLLLALALVLIASFVLAALDVASPRAWYRRLRYGSPRPVIVLDIETGAAEAIGFHRRGVQRVARTVYLLRDTFPGTGPTPRALTLVHCPRDLMPFLQGDDTAGWLVEHSG
jgi:hypothetical protein